MQAELVSWFPAINFGILIVILGQMLIREYMLASESRSAVVDTERLKVKLQAIEDRLRDLELGKIRNNPAP